VVRRALWREIFDLVDLNRESMPDQKWDRLYAALANGGHIEKAETTVRPDAIRARRTAMPVLSLLGAALYGSHMAGRARVSNAWLDCAEATAASVPNCSSTVPMRELLADESRVRHVDREEQDPEVSGVTPMPTTVETVIAGAVFVGHAHIAPLLEASAWAHGLDLIRHMGGKSGQGFGEVLIEHDGDGAAYIAWLDEHQTALRAALVQLSEELGTSSSKKATKARKPPKNTKLAEPALQDGLF